MIIYVCINVTENVLGRTRFKHVIDQRFLVDRVRPKYELRRSRFRTKSQQELNRYDQVSGRVETPVCVFVGYTCRYLS